MGATFSCSDGLDKIELARLGSQGCRPVLDHSPVENPLHCRRRVSQDPALQGGVRAGDGVHPRLHHHHLIMMMITRRRRRLSLSMTGTSGLQANSWDSTFSHGFPDNRTGSAQMVGAPVERALRMERNFHQRQFWDCF